MLVENLVNQYPSYDYHHFTWLNPLLAITPNSLNNSKNCHKYPPINYYNYQASFANSRNSNKNNKK